MATEDEIRTAMKQVEDPELGVNVVDLGLLYGVNIDDDGNVILDMTLTSMGCPLTEQILGDSRAALEPLDGRRQRGRQLGLGPAVVARLDDRGGAVPDEGDGLWLSPPPPRRRRAPAHPGGEEGGRARARPAARQAEAGGPGVRHHLPRRGRLHPRRGGRAGAPEGVRLRILAGGCSGLEYKLDLLEPGRGRRRRATARWTPTASPC